MTTHEKHASKMRGSALVPCLLFWFLVKSQLKRAGVNPVVMEQVDKMSAEEMLRLKKYILRLISVSALEQWHDLRSRCVGLMDGRWMLQTREEGNTLGVIGGSAARVLLDAHILLWMIGKRRYLPASARQILVGEANELLFDSISIGENREARKPDNSVRTIGGRQSVDYPPLPWRATVDKTTYAA